ncbi:probable alpha,alpha-trehalose-phosphate synthase [UDP-forming] 9 [Nymphaea colorata]|nr:probable alpha,alpha-trehalose-phosphate synthase [UDP-forming] 9 [Nymphaea colorata]XP_031491617.1 probable alpha,alpha-trehalose-phosphate synthase [UDP-forming] 9 [Nymphaea colorata]
MTTEAQPSACPKRKIIVANQLPLHAQQDTSSGRWDFSMDQDSILVQLKDGLSSDVEVLYVGCLKADIDPSEQEDIAQRLLEEFKCVPTFLPPDLQAKFYHGFCKQHLWPLFHYMLPLCEDYGNRFDRSLWQAYVSVNMIFANKILEVNPDDAYVWIHDYHLMILPTILRERYHHVKLGFFLHSPFPSSEIYRTLPVRDEILRGLLNSDLIGFHTFDYARHFLSCCSRMLGLDYESKRGYIGLEYYGRTVSIKILPVGVHMGQLASLLNLPETSARVKEIQEQFKGRTLILGVDDMDIFKGISLKLLAVERLLDQHGDLQGQIVMVQIANPARTSGKDIDEAKRETYATAERINQRFGYPGYKPVVLIDKPIHLYEKISFYVVAECCIVNPVRDGMNLVPYKYVVCRQGTQQLDEAMCVAPGTRKESMLVVSEFIGCSPSLSGAIRVNPWNIDAVADAIKSALTSCSTEKHMRHEKHYKYVSSHDVAYWARSFDQDLERACRDHFNKRCWGIGFGLGFRIMALSPSFRKLSDEPVSYGYRRTKRRAIFLDYDGTMTPQLTASATPSPEVIAVLNGLCSDPKNTVFIVSGRGRASLSRWFSSCVLLGIAAEHGYFMRWHRDSEWESPSIPVDFDWKQIAEPVMKVYTETTDGSSIEVKESALVWHHGNADPDFGSCQAKELLDHLESVLANEPVMVTRGQHIVEVKPQGVGKGWVAARVLSTMSTKGEPPDFILCIGDDRSDEDMFESISNSAPSSAEIFACTVGRKPSKATYYLNDTEEVIRLLESLAITSDESSQQAFGQVLFESSA